MNLPMLSTAVKDKDAVKKLQTLLNEKQNSALAVDGIFGQKTRDAVRAYQRANNLQVDGIVGEKTWASLLKTQAPQAPTATETAKQALDSFTPTPFRFSQEALREMTEDAYRNREAFAYNPTADALYRQYKASYTAQGKQAMADALGKAQAQTGGYGNSYAQTVGQQAYNRYLQELSHVLPELYQLAYRRYQGETDRLKEQLSQLEKQEQAEAKAWQQDNDSRKKALEDAYAAAKKEEKERYTRLAALLKMGYSPSDEELRQAGMTRKQADALYRG